MNIFRSYKPALLTAVAGVVALGVVLVKPGVAYAAGVDEETAFVLNTFAFLVWGALIMWMCAGFTMLESGSVRTKNASMICLKNVGIYSIAGLAYFIVGYNLMYGDLVFGFIGSFDLLYGPSAEEITLLNASDGAVAGATVAVLEAAKSNEANYSTMSD